MWRDSGYVLERLLEQQQRIMAKRVLSWRQVDNMERKWGDPGESWSYAMPAFANCSTHGLLTCEEGDGEAPSRVGMASLPGSRGFRRQQCCLHLLGAGTPGCQTELKRPTWIINTICVVQSSLATACIVRFLTQEFLAQEQCLDTWRIMNN